VGSRGRRGPIQTTERAIEPLLDFLTFSVYVTPVDGVLRMARRVAVLVVLAALGLTLSGCGPCGFEWPWASASSATACRGGPPVK